MTTQNKHRTIPVIEQELRQSLTAMEAANDETSAAQAYTSLKSNLEDFIRKTAELRNEYFKIKNTVTQQAHTLAEIELVETIGEKAPGEATPHPPVYEIPETITVQNSPDFFFIRLSYGFVNIRHIVELDVKSRTLHTLNSNRHLSGEDVRTLLFHLKMFQP